MDNVSVASLYFILFHFVFMNVTCIPQRQPMLTENDILRLSLRTHTHVNKRMYKNNVNMNNKEINISSSNHKNDVLGFSTPPTSPRNSTYKYNYAHNNSMKEEIRAIFAKVHFSFKSSRLRSRQTAKGMLPSCRCKWPDLSQDGAEPQPCPPPNIKCEICMSDR